MSKLSPSQKALSGAIASVLANTIVYPLDLVKTIIQTQDKKTLRYENSIDCLVKLYKSKGLKSLYAGLNSSLIGTALQNFYYFYWYSIIRNVYNKFHKNKRQKRIFDELLMGIIAAAITQFFISPINVITTKQQTEDDSVTLSPESESTELDESKLQELQESTLKDSKLKFHKDSIIGTGYQIVKEQGVTQLWNGLKVSLVLSLNPSITYGSYEKLKNLMFQDKEFLNPLESFSLGLLSKIIATLITQPLIVSKANLQKLATQFTNFQSVLIHLYKEEGVKGLWKGVGPQIVKASLVQGFLFMFKEQFDLFLIFVLQLMKR